MVDSREPAAEGRARVSGSPGLAHQICHHLLDPEEEYARPADNEVRSGGSNDGVRSREDPAPEQTRDKSCDGEGEADMRMRGCKDEIGD